RPRTLHRQGDRRAARRNHFGDEPSGSHHVRDRPEDGVTVPLKTASAPCRPSGRRLAPSSCVVFWPWVTWWPCYDLVLRARRSVRPVRDAEGRRRRVRARHHRRRRHGTGGALHRLRQARQASGRDRAGPHRRGLDRPARKGHVSFFPNSTPWASGPEAITITPTSITDAASTPIDCA